MSADPLGGLLGGSIHQHVEDGDDTLPMLEHAATSQLDPPPLEHQTTAGPDFWIDPADQVPYSEYFENYFDQVEQALAQAHSLTGWFNVQNSYGFTGRGQTVAVIDSGIAWNHFALGGGLGTGYRVVGGWDFTENDSNPYDDGASGGHGTHVGGIIGGGASTHSGVAPGVDLIGLRVFNDAGAGYFSWVESALQWVHANRNNFANPITAINLSLGVSSWNSASVPLWATLEDEFAQLEADGIFIAVAAGNSFGNYNTPGLSYPAASPYVVPVMSADDSGGLSYYSQRLARAIAAPGRSIVSTVPDYLGNNNGVADDYASMSGTSMASPYVAGASVLVRQAMEFVGMTNIDQDTIYDHLISTADTLFDAATQLAYKRLNLSRAIDALMPSDDYGSTSGAAHDMGMLAGAGVVQIDGALGRLNDADFFRFTASSSGQVTLSVVNADSFAWNTIGLGTYSQSGSEITLDVVAGQTYTVGLVAADVVSRFQLNLNYSLASGIETPLSALQAAFNVDQQLGLNFTGSYSTNWGGRGEKWMLAADNSWYFITPDGSLHRWAGGSLADLTPHTLVASLTNTHFVHPNLVHVAPNPDGDAGQLHYALDAELKLEAPGGYHENWGGYGEKWLKAGDGRWYFVTPDGSFYEWDGRADLSTSPLIAELDADVHSTPQLLHAATASDAALPQLARQLDLQYGLQFSASYHFNWGGMGEKWMAGSGSTWFFITPSGNLYQWNGQSNLAASQLIATLDGSYYANPTLLHEAATLSGHQQQLAGQSFSNAPVDASLDSEAYAAALASIGIEQGARTSAPQINRDRTRMDYADWFASSRLVEQTFAELGSDNFRRSGAMSDVAMWPETQLVCMIADTLLSEADEGTVDQLFELLAGSL